MKRNGLRVDYKALRTIDHECRGCSGVAKSCCAKYDVSVTGKELKRILAILPEAAKFCPHLRIDGGFDNVFEEEGGGLYAIETRGNDLCVFAFREDGLIRCSLHAVETKLGLSLGSIKPAMCVLWPLTFSEDGHVLTLHDGALFCGSSSPRKKPSRHISPAFIETIGIMTGKIPRPSRKKAGKAG